MNHRILAATALVAALGLATTVAQANPIAIYNTGTAASGSGLATAGAADPHWTMCSTTPTTTAPSSPCATTPVSATVVNQQPGVWATNAASQWIGPKANESTGAGGTDPAGYYIYQTTFDLTGLIPGTAQLSGSFAVDNCVTAVFVNGTNVGIANPSASSNCGISTNLTSFLNFSIGPGSGFINGINTLTFVMQNGAGASGNPSGLNVLVSGTAEPSLSVPEPAPLGLFGLGLLGLGGMWLRRRA